MKILLFGATGMLGKALMCRWKEDQVLGLGSAQADIRNPEQVEEIVSHAAPDWIVLSAAYTDVDGCELNPTLASTVNTHGAVHVAKAAAQAHSRLLFISTDSPGFLHCPYLLAIWSGGEVLPGYDSETRRHSAAARSRERSARLPYLYG